MIKTYSVTPALRGGLGACPRVLLSHNMTAGLPSGCHSKPAPAKAGGGHDG